MHTPPTAEEVRTLVVPLDELDRKVLGGLTAVMIAQSDKVRDQEWMSEQFVHLAVVAHGIEEGEQNGDVAPSASTEDVERIRAYANARMPDIMLAAAKLFVRVAEDLRGRESYNFDDAQALVREYLLP